MKKSKDELMKQIEAYDISDDIKIELMEDVSDSLEVSETDDKTEEITELQKKYDDLKAKYKERFLAPVDKKDEKEEVIEEGLEEKKEIDIKEI